MCVKAKTFLCSLKFELGGRFDVAGRVTGFGNPDWARTHPAAESTAPAVSAILSGGATSIGITVMDEMAYWLVQRGLILLHMLKLALLFCLQKF